MNIKIVRECPICACETLKFVADNYPPQKPKAVTCPCCGFVIDDMGYPHGTQRWFVYLEKQAVKSEDITKQWLYRDGETFGPNTYFFETPQNSTFREDSRTSEGSGARSGDKPRVNQTPTLTGV